MSENLYDILSEVELQRIGSCIGTINDKMQSITSEYYNSDTYMSLNYMIEKLKPVMNDVKVLSNILGIEE